MRIIITAATNREYEICLQHFHTLSSSHQIMFLTTGVGMLATAVSLTSIIYEQKPELLIQAGIAGAFDKNISLGNVVVVKNEFLADTGVMEENVWKDIFDLHLMNNNDAPFEKKSLPNLYLSKYNLLGLKEVNAVTINEITTSTQRIKEIERKYNPSVESMEGAALHYSGRKFRTPFIQLRSVSNYVGERDKSKWKMKEAIENLNEVLMKYLKELEYP